MVYCTKHNIWDPKTFSTAKSTMYVQSFTTGKGKRKDVLPHCKLRRRRWKTILSWWFCKAAVVAGFWGKSEGEGGEGRNRLLKILVVSKHNTDMNALRTSEHTADMNAYGIFSTVNLNWKVEAPHPYKTLFDLTLKEQFGIAAGSVHRSFWLRTSEHLTVAETRIIRTSEAPPPDILSANVILAIPVVLPGPVREMASHTVPLLFRKLWVPATMIPQDTMPLPIPAVLPYIVITC